MIKDHHLVLDRAVDKLQIRLDEFKVRRSGRAQRREDSSLAHSDSPQRFHRHPEGRGTRDTFLAFYCV